MLKFSLSHSQGFFSLARFIADIKRPERLQHNRMIPAFRSKTLLVSLISTVAITPIPSLAQPAPVLRKEWKGIATVTAMGAPAPIHPQHKANIATGNPAKTWNAYQEIRTIEILKQQGRHMEIALISPRGYQRLMHGSFAHFTTNHAAICWDFTAVMP